MGEAFPVLGRKGSDRLVHCPGILWIAVRPSRRGAQLLGKAGQLCGRFLQMESVYLEIITSSDLFRQTASDVVLNQLFRFIEN